MAMGGTDIDTTPIVESVPARDESSWSEDAWLSKMTGRDQPVDEPKAAPEKKAVEKPSSPVVESEEVPEEEAPLEDEAEDPDAPGAEDEQPETPEVPAAPVEPERLLAGEFRTPAELEQAHVQLKQEVQQYAGWQAKQMDQLRGEVTQARLQLARAAVPAEPLQFNKLSDRDREVVANLAAQNGFDNPQQFLYLDWREKVNQANKAVVELEHAEKNREAAFQGALKEIQAHIRQPQLQPFAAEISREWDQHPEFFEVLSRLEPKLMLPIAKRFTDLVASQAAFVKFQAEVGSKVQRARQEGREEHKLTRASKLSGRTEAQRTSAVAVAPGGGGDKKGGDKKGGASGRTATASKINELLSVPNQDIYG